MSIKVGEPAPAVRVEAYVRSEDGPVALDIAGLGDSWFCSSIRATSRSPVPDGSALWGTFIIDPQGVVRHASVSDPSVGRSPEEALRILKALRTGELCPVSWQPGQPTLRIAA
ncbi:MAG TPA: hypothetical protein VF056_12630 [Thermoleophilaceae bacterium]